MHSPLARPSLSGQSHDGLQRLSRGGNWVVKIKRARRVLERTQLKPSCLARFVLLSLFLLIVLPRSSLICIIDGILKCQALALLNLERLSGLNVWIGRVSQIQNNDSADDVRDVDLTKIHYLTGPFDIKGSEPGDLLAVNITDVQPFDHSPWGFTGVFAKNNGGGFLEEHYPNAAKAIWDFDGVYCTSRHIPGVRFAGLIHPGILGCAPSAEVLAEWNRREADLVSSMAHSHPNKVVAQPPNAQNAHAGQASGDVYEKIAKEGARTIPGRPEHGGNCDINNISRGSTTYLPVHVAGAKFSVGDLHFSQGDGEISFCGAIEMAGIITIKFDLIKNGMKTRGLKSPVFKPGDMGPSYGPSRYLIFEGFSVDEQGKQHFMDATVAYRQSCLRAIEYLKQYGYTGEQIYLLLSSAPVRGTIAGIVDIPNVCTTLGIPMDIFDFDIAIENEPVKRSLGSCPVSM